MLNGRDIRLASSNFGSLIVFNFKERVNDPVGVRMQFEYSSFQARYQPARNTRSAGNSSNFLDHPSGLTPADVNALRTQSNVVIPDDGNRDFLQQAQAKAVDQLSTGMGQLVAQNDKQLFTAAKYVIYEKMHWASFLGTVQNDPVAQVKMLLSAFGDAEWYIGNVLADFDGVELPPDARDGIAAMRALQGLLIAHIRGATGLNLSDDEFRALLEKAPWETQQKISLNELIRDDRTLRPGPDSRNQQMDAAIETDKKNHMSDDSIYGIQSNPAKYQRAMASANKKMVKDMENIVRQASVLVEKAEHEPAANMDTLLFALAMLRRGLTMTLVGKALEEYQPLNKQDGNYGNIKARFDELLQKTVGLLKSQGIPAAQMISPTAVSGVQPSGNAFL